MIPLPSQTSPADLDAALRATDHAGRVAWIRRLSRREMKGLWEACAGRNVPLDYLHGAEGETVVHVGQNSLPLFRGFEKHVVKRGDVVQGYNRQPLSWITGPGHYTVVEDRGTALFDYTLQPTSAPEQFPVVRSWFYGISWFVYANMRDYLRRVSEDVVIGQAEKKGAPIGAYFVLVRTPRA